jgi:hypothetical protein
MPDASAQPNPAGNDGARRGVGDPNVAPGGPTAFDPRVTVPVPSQAGPGDVAVATPDVVQAARVSAVSAVPDARSTLTAPTLPLASASPGPSSPGPSSAVPWSTGPGPYPYPVAGAGGPWTYPTYLPASRPRRGPAVPMLVAAIVIAFIAAVGVAVVRTAKPAGSGHLGLVGAPAAGTRPDDSLSSVLNAQSSALIDGNETGFLAPVDPGARSAIAAYQRMYTNLKALHVTTFDQSADSRSVDGPADVDVEISYCFVYLCGDTDLTVSVDLVKGKPEIVAYTPPAVSADQGEPLPWQASTLSVVTGTDVIVAADAAEKSQLSRVLPMAERAAVAANKYAHWEEVPTYVVYLASKRDARTWFGGILEDSIGEAVSLENTDIEVMVVLPDAANHDYTGAGGLEMVIQHEMGHVATLYNDSQNSGYDSFIEGIAEYVAYTGHATWDDYRLADTREYVREGKWSGQCYLTKEISSSDGLTGSAAYGIGYLTIKYLVGKYGKAAMLAFWGGVERDGLSVADGAKVYLGSTWTKVNAACASYIRQTLYA